MQTTFLLFFGICCFIPLAFSNSFVKVVGDECYNYNKNKTGVCLLLNDCPEEKKAEGITREEDLKDICGFSLHVPIVCCPKRRICQKKCEEYSKAVEQNVYIPILIPGQRKKLTESICHIKPTFVSGGVDAESGEFPHMAILGFGEGNEFSWGCGGSLISDQYVLTAAHCMYSYTLNVTRVRLGALKLNNNPHYIQEYDIIERIRFPDYTRREKYHDIALVKLSKKVKFSKWVRPACLDTGDYFLGNINYTVTGWGHLSHSNKQLSKVLQKAPVEIFKNEECNKSYEGQITKKFKDGVLEDRMICAAGRNIARDTCPGDSGGPLQTKHPNATCMYTIVGVTSFGQQSCGVAGVPAVYTRVSHYIDWIESVVWS